MTNVWGDVVADKPKTNAFGDPIAPTAPTGDEVDQGELASAERVSDLAAAAKQTPEERHARGLEILGDIPETATRPLVKIAHPVSSQQIADAIDVLKTIPWPSESPYAEPIDTEASLTAIGDLPTRPPSRVEKIAGGAHQAVSDAVNFFTSPLGIATLGTGALPGALQKATAALFVSQMAASAPEQIGELVSALKEGDAERASKAAVSLGLDAAFIAQGGKAILEPPGRRNINLTPRTFRTESERTAAEHLRTDIPRREAYGELAEGSLQRPPSEETPSLQPAASTPLLLTPPPAVSEATLDRLEAEAKSPETKVAEAVGPATAKAVEQTKGVSPSVPSPTITQRNAKGLFQKAAASISRNDLEAALFHFEDSGGGAVTLNSAGDALKYADPEQMRATGKPGVGSTSTAHQDFVSWLLSDAPITKDIEPETRTAIAAMRNAITESINQTKGIENARPIPSTESVSEREVRPRMGEETPLRQQGAPAATQEPAPQGSVNAPELAGGAQGEARGKVKPLSRAQAGKAFRTLVEGDRALVAKLIVDIDARSGGRGTGPKSTGVTEFINWLMSGKVSEGIAPDALQEHMRDVERARQILNQAGIGQARDLAGEPPISEASGIGIAPGATAYKAISDKLASFREKIASGWASRGNKADIARLKDTADSESKIIANQQRKSVELEAQKEFGDETPQALKAVTAVIETGGDRAKLVDFYNQSYGKHLEATKAAEFAQANWDRLQPLAARIKAIHDNQIAQEHLVGIDTEYRENYIRHAYDVEKLPNRGAEFFAAKGAAGSRSGFKAARKFETLYDAIEAGYGNAIKSLNAAKLVESRLQAGQQLVNDRMWVNGFKSVNDPTTGNPIVGPPVTYDKNHFPIAAPGYDAVGVAGQFIAVHNGYRGIFDTVTGASKLQNFEAGGLPVGAAALNTAAGIKHGLLLFDTFHASRIMQKQFFLTGHVGWAKGLSILEYNAGDLAEAVRQGEITQEMANFANANRPTAQLLVKNGLNVGRIQEALRSEVVRNWPVVGPFNRWVFDKVTRGAMMEASLTEFERVQGANPTWGPEQVAAKVAKDINVTFGNIGRQGIFRGRTGQDLMRLVALAPQWVESMARSEIGGFGQLAAAPFNGMKLGTLGKTMAGGLISYVAATQVLNYITRGHSTFENPEDGHKLDAWIPDLAFKMGLSKKDSGGFFLSPLSVVAELTHDAYRYAFRQDNAIDILGQIGQNKMSPLLRSQKVLWTGKNYSGEKIVDTWKRIAQSGAALIPAPIPVSGFASDRPGQAQRQLFGSAGVKMEPAPTAVQQIGAKARDFTAKHGKPAEVDIVYHEGSPYNSLRKSLRSGDEAGAKAAIQELRKTRKDSDIVNAMAKSKTHPFTGSAAMESKFKASLSQQERELYDKAKAEKKATYEQFQKVWRERGPR